MQTQPLWEHSKASSKQLSREWGASQLGGGAAFKS